MYNKTLTNYDRSFPVSFSDLTFLFYFLPLFFAVYYILPFRFKNAALVLGSFAFYFIGRGARATHCCCPACCFCTMPSPAQWRGKKSAREKHC